VNIENKRCSQEKSPERKMKNGSRPRAAGPHGFFVNYMNIENKRCSQEKSEEDWDHQALSWRFFSAIEYSNQEDV